MSEGKFNLSALAVRERSITLFLIILITVAGILAFFELPKVSFEFKEQDPSDLHIALEVEDATMKAMFEKGKAQGHEAYGPVELEALRSIYFRDPNGYIVELTTKLDSHDEVMNPDTNNARGILDRWQVEKVSS